MKVEIDTAALADAVADRLEGQLGADAGTNVALVRSAMLAVLDELPAPFMVPMAS